jgi:hypothetical protein
MPMTDAQLRFFNTFGYIKFPGLFKDEFSTIEKSFHEVWDMQGGGHAGESHDGEKRSALVPFVDQHEYLSGLIDDPRIDGVASAILGDDYNYMFSDGKFFVGPTYWHSDRYYNKPYNSVKIAFYLDSVTKDSGCLRVLPGTHNVGDKFGDAVQEAMPHSDHQNYEETWGMEGSNVPAIPLESEPGDMLAFNHKIKHCAYGGNNERRMFTVSFQNRHPENDLERLRDELTDLIRFWHPSAYGDVMIDTASPARMRHLEQRLALDGHMAELVAKAKAEMVEPSRG